MPTPSTPALPPRRQTAGRRLARPLVAAAVIVALTWGTAGASALIWNPPGPLNTNASTDTGPDSDVQIATDGAGTWIAMWESRDSLGGTIGTDADMLFARSTDGGATWTSPSPLNTNAASDSGNDLFPELATDGAGTWIAVWASFDSLGGTIGGDTDILFALSTDSGVTWTPPAPLNGNAASDSGSDGFADLAADGTGTSWVAVWESRDTLGGTIGTDNDILVARSTNGGATWTPPAALNTNAASDGGTDSFPQIATDGAGTWVAVWMSTDTLGGTIGADFDILVARSIDGGATWTPPAALNTNAAADGGEDYSPQITTDGAGTWLTVWHSTDSLGGTIGGDVDVLVARSTDGGASWTPPAPVNTDAASDTGSDQSPQVATDRAGTWVAVWHASEPGADLDILFAASRDGGVTWTAPTPVNTNAAADTGGDLGAELATDRAGTWVAAWSFVDSLGGPLGADSDILTARGIALPLDHYACYVAKPTKGSAKFVPVPGLAVVDPAAAESLAVTLKKPRHLCAPAAVGTGSVSDLATHLESYDVKLAKGSPKLVKRTNVRVLNALGELRVDTVKATRVLVPTAKDPTSDPPPPDPALHDVDHYRCDTLKLAKGAPKFPKGLRVTVGDQFTAPARLVELKKPRLLCTPAEVDGATITTPAGHLVCYQVKRARAACAAGAPTNAGGFCKREEDCGGQKGATSLCVKQPKRQPALGLHVANAFEIGGRLDARKDDLVCVPSLENP